MRVTPYEIDQLRMSGALDPEWERAEAEYERSVGMGVSRPMARLLAQEAAARRVMAARAEREAA